MKLSDIKRSQLNDILEGFGFGAIQTGAHLLATLMNSRISNDEFLGWVEQKVIGIKLEIAESKKNSAKQIKELKYHTRRCPDCGAPLNITPVNTSKRDQVGGEYRSAWQCADSINCGYEDYSTKIVEEEISNHSAELAQLYKRARNANKRR